MVAADQIARLRVATATGVLPPDLGEWALASLADLLSSAERIEARNDLLRRASRMIDGTTRARARTLRSEIVAMPRRREIKGAVRQLVFDAIRLDPACPRSERQLYRILECDIQGGEMSHRTAA